MRHGGAGQGDGHGRSGDWWSSDSARPDSAWSGADLPGWAVRHLDDPSQDAALAPSAPAPSPRSAHRHRASSTAAAAPSSAAPFSASAPSRLRGWGLALVSVAAAAAAVPMAVSSLAHQDDSVPSVGTFPVVSPEQLGGGAHARAGGPRPEESGPLTGVSLSPGVSSAPTAVPAPEPLVAQSRTTVAPRRSATVTPPPRVVVVPPSRPVTTSPTTSRSDPRPSRDPDRSGPRSTTDPGTGGNGSGDDGGLLGGVVGTVGSVGNTLGNTVNGLTG